MNGPPTFLATRRRAALLLIPLALACGTTLPEEPVFAPRLFPQRDFRLHSGLRVLVQEDHTSPLVVVAAVYGSGATADPHGASGLAHMVEHLVFRAGGAGGKRADRLKRTGATFNAFTTADNTSYYAVAPPDVLGDLLDIEVDRLAHPLDGITDADLSIERQVVLAERRERLGGALGLDVLDELRGQLFPAGHPLAQSFAGSEASLAAVTLALARGYASQHYRPENCTLVIAGDVQAPQVQALMQRWPNDVVDGPDGPGGPARPHRMPANAEAPEPPPVRPTLHTTKGAVASPRLLVAWSLPGLSHANEAVLSMTAAAMRVAVLRAFALGIFVPSSDGSILAAELPMRPGDSPTKLRERVLATIADARLIAASARAENIIKVEASAALLRASADPVASALGLAGHLAATGRASLYRDTSEALANVGRFEVVAAIDRYLTPARAVTLVVEPDLAAGDEDEEAPSETGERHHLARSIATNLAGMSNEDVLRVARPPALGNLSRFRLPNGLSVLAIERRNAPMALVNVMLPGGNATTQPFGLAVLAAGLSRSSCSTEHLPLSRVAGTLRQVHGKIDSELSVLAPEGNLANALAAAADEVTCRELGRSEFEQFTSLLRTRGKSARPPTIAQQASRAFWAALYPDHPYGKVEGDLASLVAVDREAAGRYVEGHFRPDRATAVVVSARPARLVRPLVEEFFGGWEAAHVTPPTPTPPPAPPARVVRTFAAGKGGSSFVEIGCRLPAPTAATMPTFDVLEHVVEEQAEELRESWGATYGMHVAVRHLPGAAHLLIFGTVNGAETGAAVARLLDLLRTNASKGPDVRTWTVARWDVARGYDYRFATPAGTARALMFGEAHDLGEDVWDLYPQRLAQSTRADVRALLQDCAGHEVVSVIGDAAATAQVARAVH